MTTHVLTSEVSALLNDEQTLKILATVDGDGVPHAVVKQSLHAPGDGTVHLLEFLESSTTQRNLVRSIWYGKPLAIALKGKGGESVQIKGKAVKTHISGPLFQKHYREVRDRFGDIELAAVWVIRPEQVIDQSFAQRKASEDAAHPGFIHLDRIAKGDNHASH